VSVTDTPINLNRVRKARARADKARQADANAAAFGRSKAEKGLDAAKADLARTRLDAHRRTDDKPDP
jgi:hypothetical protein